MLSNSRKFALQKNLHYTVVQPQLRKAITLCTSDFVYNSCASCVEQSVCCCWYAHNFQLYRNFRVTPRCRNIKEKNGKNKGNDNTEQMHNTTLTYQQENNTISSEVYIGKKKKKRKKKTKLQRNKGRRLHYKVGGIRCSTQEMHFPL